MHCCMIHMKVVKKVNPKNAHHKEKIYVFLYLYEIMHVN